MAIREESDMQTPIFEDTEVVETTTFDELEAQIDYFTKVSEALGEFGATDTEPRTVFGDIVETALAGFEPDIPDTPDGWQLFDMDGSRHAATVLGHAAVGAVDVALRLRDEDLEKVDEHFHYVPNPIRPLA